MKRSSSIAGFLLSFFALFLFLTPEGRAQSRGGSSGSANDGFYFEETFFPVYVSKNDAVSPAGGAPDRAVPTESGLGFDTNTTLAYIWSSVLIGVTYNYYQLSTKRPRTADYEGLKTKTDRQAWGPSLGYFLGSWRIMFTYFIDAKKKYTQTYTDPSTGDVTTDEVYNNTDGKGFQVALGYDFDLGAGFGISPTLIYRKLSYEKQSLDVRTGSTTP